MPGWMTSLRDASPDRPELKQSDKWLVESGLYDAIRHGSIKTQE